MKYLIAALCFGVCAGLITMPLFLATTTGTVVFLFLAGAGILAVIV